MGKILRLELQQIHPTQVTAGMLEVEEKRKHFASLSADELKRALKATPIPVVLGRDGTQFATDHHYLARALSDAKIEHAYVEIMAASRISKETPFGSRWRSRDGYTPTTSSGYCTEWRLFPNRCRA
jgi:hypothetical protein